MKKVWRNSDKKSEKVLFKDYTKYWQTLSELPLYNWRRCISGEIIYVRKEIDVSSQENALDQKIWELIYDAYLLKFGLDKLHKKFIEIQKKRCLYQINYVKTGDRFKLTQIELEEERMKNMLSNSGKGMTIDESLIHLSKWMGYRLNEYQVSAMEYFTILEQYGKSSKT